MVFDKKPKLRLVAELTASYAEQTFNCIKELKSKYESVANSERRSHLITRDMYARNLFPPSAKFGSRGYFYLIASYQADDRHIMVTISPELELDKDLLKDNFVEKYAMGDRGKQLARSSGKIAAGIVIHKDGDEYHTHSSLQITGNMKMESDRFGFHSSGDDDPLENLLGGGLQGVMGLATFAFTIPIEDFFSRKGLTLSEE